MGLAQLNTHQLATRFLSVHHEIKRLEKEVETHKQELRLIEEALLQRFTNQQLQSIKTEDGQTLYIHSQLWAKPIAGDQAMVVNACRLQGLEWLVEEKVNIHKLSAYIRESYGRDMEGKSKGAKETWLTLPHTLSNAIDVTQQHRIRVRQS